MSLLDEAAADLKSILGGDFSQPITVTNPDGESAVINGQANLIGTTLDLQTGAMVAGRRASVALSMAALAGANIGQPKGMSDGARKPWRVEFTTPNGVVHPFKVSSVLPDEGIGCLVCLLENWKS